MFPEYRDLITSLKHRDMHFTRLFDKHNELDQKILNMESTGHGSDPFQVEALKKEKLRIKDELYQILRKASGVNGS